MTTKNADREDAIAVARDIVKDGRWATAEYQVAEVLLAEVEAHNELKRSNNATVYYADKCMAERDVINEELTAALSKIVELERDHEISMQTAIRMYDTLKSQASQLELTVAGLKGTLKECGRYGYWGKDTKRETLIEVLDHVTDIARRTLAEWERK